MQYRKMAWKWRTKVQISAKRGPDSTFAVEVNTKTCPKSSRFRLVKMMDRDRVIQPQVEYWVEYRVKYWVEYLILGEFLSKKVDFILESGSKKNKNGS